MEKTEARCDLLINYLCRSMSAASLFLVTVTTAGATVQESNVLKALTNDLNIELISGPLKNYRNYVVEVDEATTVSGSRYVVPVNFTYEGNVTFTNDQTVPLNVTLELVVEDCKPIRKLTLDFYPSAFHVVRSIEKVTLESFDTEIVQETGQEFFLNDGVFEPTEAVSETSRTVVVDRASNIVRTYDSEGDLIEIPLPSNYISSYAAYDGAQYRQAIKQDLKTLEYTEIEVSSEDRVELHRIDLTEYIDARLTESLYYIRQYSENDDSKQGDMVYEGSILADSMGTGVALIVTDDEFRGLATLRGIRYGEREQICF